MDTMLLKRTRDTEQAAKVCIRIIEGGPKSGTRHDSPLLTASELIRSLHQDAAVDGQFWFVDDRADEPQRSAAIGAWPLWISERARNDERPLFYLTQSPTSRHLSTLTAHTAGRGIILNDIESAPSRWSKGAHPWLPLWLASNRQCMPFDPACGEEVKAILAGALHDLYMRGEPGFCYMTLHDEPVEQLSCDRTHAYLGMYRLPGPASAAPRIRLLGAGLALREVRAAARMLKDDWGIDSEVWSCPSYTRLARDAAHALRWNATPGGHARQTSHLHACLERKRLPVIAVTAYVEFVPAQLGAYLDVPFTALGADTFALNQCPDRNWITYCALNTLAQQGQLATQELARALDLYGLNTFALKRPGFRAAARS
ncbi:pyruvate dehydrogenase [Burkholderia sp. JP2-270]|uniref:transketolase-like TK C-terminal-containing protein n=1 Tax=Burkholderia sp. JP2-270 TaxID=2217913 RepID=UPI000DA3E09B|nr:pyruvate dehydrogenase [Burkholderia sp. JP2-270]AWV00662.1 pyruvate dehydrogenase [Burkholderia sp. JP2-270]